jgi:membrane-associated phospholipid phosphatase
VIDAHHAHHANARHGAPRANGRLALAGVLLFFAALAIALLVDQLGAPPFDRFLTVHLDGWRSGFGGAVFRAATASGYAAWLIPAGVVIMLTIGFARRSVAVLIALAVTTPIASGVNALLKLAFQRPRPTLDQFAHVGGSSMPSGHAATSAAFAGAIWLALPAGPWRRTLGTLALLYAATVGLSRVVLGVHWSSDVIAGWSEGAGIACIVAAATRVGVGYVGARRARAAPHSIA